MLLTGVLALDAMLSVALDAMLSAASASSAGMGLPNTLLKLLYRDIKHAPRADRTFTRAEALARIRILQLRPHRPGAPDTSAHVRPHRPAPTTPRPTASSARPARPVAGGPAARATGDGDASADSDADSRPASRGGPDPSARPEQQARAVDPTIKARSASPPFPFPLDHQGP